MSKVFIIAPGRTIGAGAYARGPGSRIPVGDQSINNRLLGSTEALSETEALQLQASGFGRISGAPIIPESPEPSRPGLVRGYDREPVVLPPGDAK